MRRVVPRASSSRAARMTSAQALRLLSKQPSEVRAAVETVLRGLVTCDEAIEAFGLAQVVEGVLVVMQGRRPDGRKVRAG